MKNIQVQVSIPADILKREFERVFNNVVDDYGIERGCKRTELDSNLDKLLASSMRETLQDNNKHLTNTINEYLRFCLEIHPITGEDASDHIKKAFSKPLNTLLSQERKKKKPKAVELLDEAFGEGCGLDAAKDLLNQLGFSVVKKTKTQAKPKSSSKTVSKPSAK